MENKEVPDQWTKSLIIPIPKKGDSRKCSNYRTLSLIPHARKILLRIILNPQAETILAEEEASLENPESQLNKSSIAEYVKEDVKIFKYLGASLKSDGASGNELRIRIATSTYAMIRLNIIWTSKNIGFKIKFNLYRSLVLSIRL